MKRFTRSFLFALILLVLFGARAVVSDYVSAETLQTVASVFRENDTGNNTGAAAPKTAEPITTDHLFNSTPASARLTAPDAPAAMKSLLRSDPELKREIFSLLRNEKYDEARQKLVILLDSYTDNEAGVRTLLRLVRELEQEPSKAERDRLLDAIAGADSAAEEISGVSRDLEQINEKLKSLELADPKSIPAAAEAQPATTEPTAIEASNQAPEPDLESGAVAPLDGTAPAIPANTVSGESAAVLLRPAPLIPTPPPTANQETVRPDSLEIDRLRSNLRVTCSPRAGSARTGLSARQNGSCINLISSAFQLAVKNSDSALAANALDAVSRLRFSASHPPEPASAAEVTLVDSIAASVSAQSDGVAWNGAAALGQIYPVSHRALLGLLRSQNGAERARGAFALGLARADSAVGVLGLALGDQEPAVRNEAVRALRRIGTKSALETFEGYASREIPRIADKLKKSSAAISTKPAAGETGTESEEPLDPSQAEPPDPAADLIMALHEASSLGASAESLYPDIVPLLANSNPDIKIEALETLASINATNAAADVAPLLESSDSSVSTVAAEALVRFGESSVAPVSELLSSSDKSIRLRATAVLGRLGKNGITARDRLLAVGATDQNEMQADASMAALKNIPNH